MERKINRLDKYMIYKGLNDNKISKECGLSNGLLGNARRGDADLGAKTIDKILNKYGDLNRVWLITGEGQMLNNSQNQNSGTIVNNAGHDNFFTQSQDGKDELIQQLRGEVEYLRSIVKTLTTK